MVGWREEAIAVENSSVAPSVDALSWQQDFKIEKCNPDCWILLMEKGLDFHLSLKNFTHWRDFRTICCEGQNLD